MNVGGHSEKGGRFYFTRRTTVPQSAQGCEKIPVPQLRCAEARSAGETVRQSPSLANCFPAWSTRVARTG
jgi:hypothetical protein